MIKKHLAHVRSKVVNCWSTENVTSVSDSIGDNFADLYKWVTNIFKI